MQVFRSCYGVSHEKFLDKYLQVRILISSSNHVVIVRGSNSIGTFCCWQQVDNFGHKILLETEIGFIGCGRVLAPAKIGHYLIFFFPL
jgi:hypothetical protein